MTTCPIWQLAPVYPIPEARQVFSVSTWVESSEYRELSLCLYTARMCVSNKVSSAPAHKSRTSAYIEGRGERESSSFHGVWFLARSGMASWLLVVECGKQWPDRSMSRQLPTLDGARTSAVSFSLSLSTFPFTPTLFRYRALPLPSHPSRPPLSSLALTLTISLSHLFGCPTTSFPVAIHCCFALHGLGPSPLVSSVSSTTKHLFSPALCR